MPEALTKHLDELAVAVVEIAGKLPPGYNRGNIRAMLQAMAKRSSDDNGPTCRIAAKNAREVYWHTLQTEPQKLMPHNAQRAASRFNVPINITVDDSAIPARRPAFDIPLQRSTGVAGEASPCVVRIEPRLGYLKGNIIVVSSKAARDPVARTLPFKTFKAESDITKAT